MMTWGVLIRQVALHRPVQLFIFEVVPKLELSKIVFLQEPMGTYFSI